MNVIKKQIYRLKEKIFKHGIKLDKIGLSIDDADTIESFAEKYLNIEPERKDNNGDWSLEYRLAASGSSISDRFRNNQADELDHKIEQMLKRYQIRKKVVVYRGIPPELLEKMFQYANGIKKADLVDKGFLSTSLIKGKEEPLEIRLRILVPEGTNAIYMGDVNGEKERYYELTIQRGAHLKILSIDNEYINCQLLKTL